MKEMRHRNVLIMELLLSGYEFEAVSKMFNLSRSRIRGIFEVMMRKLGFPKDRILRRYKVQQEGYWLRELSNWSSIPNLTFIKRG